MSPSENPSNGTHQYSLRTWVENNFQLYGTLNIDNNQLMVGLLECEVAERLRCEAVNVRDKARVGVVLDVAALDKVLHSIQWTALPLLKLNDVRLKEIHLQKVKLGNY